MLELLVFSFFMEVGWIPDQGVVLPERVEYVEDVFYLDMDAHVQFSILWIRAGMKVYSWPVGWDRAIPSFWPARTDYRFSAGLAFGIITVGLRHLCSHSVDAYGRITDPVDGFYDELFVRLEGTVGGKR